MIAMEELLTIEEVARILRISEYTAREMCKRQEINARKIGRNWKVKQEDLRKYIDAVYGKPEEDQDKK